MNSLPAAAGMGWALYWELLSGDDASASQLDRQDSSTVRGAKDASAFSEVLVQLHALFARIHVAPKQFCLYLFASPKPPTLPGALRVVLQHFEEMKH